MRRCLLLLLYLPAFFATAQSAHDTPWSALDKAFSCTVETADNAVIKLRRLLETGNELGVETPNGDFFFLIMGSGAPEGDLPITSSQFIGMNEIELDAASTYGHSSLKQTQERVFAASGKYKFYLSDNLESDIGGYVCHVDIDQDAR